MKYETGFRICFAEICRKYGLKVDVVDDREIALVGQSFLLIFSLEHTDWYLIYIRRNENGVLETWHMDWYVKNCIDPKDREEIDFGDTVDALRKAALVILSRTLKNHFDDLLSGKSAWMPGYLNSRYAFVQKETTPKEKECAARNHI